jgi:hypothetical protein
MPTPRAHHPSHMLRPQFQILAGSTRELQSTVKSRAINNDFDCVFVQLEEKGLDCASSHAISERGTYVNVHHSAVLCKEPIVQCYQ